MLVFTLDFMVMVAICSVVESKVAKVNQTFPLTNRYYCHCPAATLVCTFPGDPIFAIMYVLDNGTQVDCNGYKTHVVTHNLTIGGLVVQMNSTGVSEGNIYSCFAVYRDGSTAESETMTLADFLEDVEAQITDFTATRTTTSLNISWDHPYKFCKRFTVKLNGMPVAGCDNLKDGITSCYIDGLTPGTEYNVMVIANESGVRSVTAGHSFTTEPTTEPTEGDFYNTPPGIFVCFVLPLVFVLCFIMAVVVGGACYCKTKLKKAEQNEILPTEKDIEGQISPITVHKNEFI